MYDSKAFYHVFLGVNAEKAEKAINDFMLRGYRKAGQEVSLFRKEDNRLFFYSYGELYPEAVPPRKKIRCYTELSNAFVLPVKAFAFQCPVCGEKTLQYRGMFEICDFCGWEDEGLDGDDEEPGFGPNGDYTIRQYREEYKRQLRKVHGVPYEMLKKEQKILPSWMWEEEMPEE